MRRLRDCCKKNPLSSDYGWLFCRPFKRYFLLLQRILIRIFVFATESGDNLGHLQSSLNLPAKPVNSNGRLVVFLPSSSTPFSLSD